MKNIIVFLIFVLLIPVSDINSQVLKIDTAPDFLKTETLTQKRDSSDKQSDSLEYKTETIEVNALRGIDRLTPITFENIDRETIQKKYWMQDLPMFLNGSTSINAYSESGSSVGYSYFSLRGFDQRRIAILLNGIPQNDAEDHQVYWVDLADITSSIDNIQIQRGVGTALYGVSGIGGVINLQTIDYFKRKFFNLDAGYGNYNSKRYSIEYSSGLIEGGLGVYGKFTRTLSDGYRNLSWSDHWSYFLSAGKMLGSNTVIKFNVFGSPIKNHLAYLGVTRDYLEGKITGDKLKDRKHNFLDFPNETDNYNQPHFEFVINSQISKNIYLSNSLSYIRGDGFFITNFPVYYGYDFNYFRLNPFYVSDTTTYNNAYYKRNPDGTYYFVPGKGYVIDKSDIVSKLFVNNNDYGWYPKLQIKHSNEKGNLLVGAEIRLHNSEHFGQVTFGNALPPDTPPDYTYYFYNGKKQTYSVYLNEIYSLTNNFTVMAGLQFAYHKYSIENNRYNPYNFSVDYNFLTPRFGLNYNFNKNISAYVNFSIAKREPRLKDIYNAEDPFAKPNFRIIDTSKGRYEDALVKPEEMFNYEAGIGYANDIINANLNFYYMDFRNEIVSNGQLDNVGQPINGNAGKSVHSGIELEFGISPFKLSKSASFLKGLYLQGNLNLSNNYFKEYREILGSDSSGNIIYGNDYSDNKILLTPGIIGNLTLGYSGSFGINAYICMQHIGKQYLDNSENEKKNNISSIPGYVDKVINAYTVFNAGISFDIIPSIKNSGLAKMFRSLEISFKANNIFDTLYETTGSVDSYGTPYWIPAATRNFYINLKAGF